MLTTLFGKKKITQDKTANIFVNTVLNLVDNSFEDVVAFIENEPEFTHQPTIDRQDYGQFLLIVITGNLNFIPDYFEAGDDKELILSITQKFAHVFDISTDELEKKIRDYKLFMNRVNHPSKNVLYGMSKAVFHKYELNDYQTDYFKSLNTPNPIFLKRLDEVMTNFLFNWEDFLDKYKVI
jgi:hypothetical protein